MGRIPTRQEMERTIRAFPDLRAGRILTAYNEISEWQWCRLVFGLDGEVERIYCFRECTEREIRALNELLWSSLICMRYKRVREGNPWALASVD